MPHHLRGLTVPLAAGATSLLLAAGPLVAQETPYLQVSAGLGYATAGARNDGQGEGVAAGLEYVNPWNLRLSGRVYVGGIYASADESSCGSSVAPCAVSSRIAVIGLRLRWLPIVRRRVGPFVKAGIGLSLGEMETRLGADGSHPAIDEHRTGGIHIPLSLGLAIGRAARHDISVDYFIHPGSEHLAGSVTANIAVW